jgi:hypothetical protein
MKKSPLKAVTKYYKVLQRNGLFADSLSGWVYTVVKACDSYGEEPASDSHQESTSLLLFPSQSPDIRICIQKFPD